MALQVSMSYLPGAEYFWIAADDPSLALSGLFYWVHLFRMTMFFLFAFFKPNAAGTLWTGWFGR